MNKIFLTIALISVSALSTGCAQMTDIKGNASQWFQGEKLHDEPQRLAESSRYRDIDRASLFSNQNVTVFSLDGDVEAQQRQMNTSGNTGGMTAFDPSVEVFAVDNSTFRPSYIPEYAVPSFGNQKTMANNSTVLQRPSPSLTGQVERPDIKFAPVAMVPRAPVFEGQNMMNPNTPSVIDSPSRRSPPILTAYE